jgi:hypothetical protein
MSMASHGECVNEDGTNQLLYYPHPLVAFALPDNEHPIVHYSHMKGGEYFIIYCGFCCCRLIHEQK